MGSINRILSAFAATPWFMDARKARQIVAVLEHRAETGQGMAFDAPEESGGPARHGAVAVLPLAGTILPRSAMLGDVSASPSIEDFQAAFREAAADDQVGAIVLDIDSPGGQIDKVPELAAEIAAARRPGRPIVAVANTLAASAAYWIACSCDEIVASPSAEVGSIGVVVVHQEVSRMLAEEGVTVTVITQGARKAETGPFAPLSEPALAHLRAVTADYYEMFVEQVAGARGVAPDVVRADPEAGGAHMGGGRSYPARMAAGLGMIDRIETLDQTVSRLRGQIATNRRRRLALA